MRRAPSVPGPLLLLFRTAQHCPRLFPCTHTHRKPESGYFDTRDDLSDLPAAGAHAGDDVDMELEEGQAPPPLPPPPLTGDEYLPGPPPGPTPGSAGRGGAGAGPSGRGGGADERWRAPSTAAAPKLPSNLQVGAIVRTEHVTCCPPPPHTHPLRTQMKSFVARPCKGAEMVVGSDDTRARTPLSSSHAVWLTTPCRAMPMRSSSRRPCWGRGWW